MKLEFTRSTALSLCIAPQDAIGWLPAGLGPRLRLGVLFSVLAIVSAQSAELQAATFTVINTSNAGVGSLRQAILDGNASGVLDNINFNIPGAGPHTISPTAALPTITSPVSINGFTQPGSSANSMSLGNNAVYMIVIDGNSAGLGASGFRISAGSSTIRGLVISRFSNHGVMLEGNPGNVVAGNFIGTDPTGTVDMGNQLHGVYISESANNTIGGSSIDWRNLISGNNSGIRVEGLASTGNSILNNYLGVTRTGAAVLGNSHGVFINGSPNNTIGFPFLDFRNVISGNVLGIWLESTSGCLVQNNYVGTNAAGTAALGNTSQGILIQHGFGNTVGGSTTAVRNVISANGTHGISLGNTDDNWVAGNYIGLDASGTTGMGNEEDGVLVGNVSTGNLIGGVTPGSRNIISSNQYGIVLNNASGTEIFGNFIGTGATGSGDFGNSADGIWIHNSSSNNAVGGAAAGRGNTVSGNDGNGIRITDCSGQTVEGNFIGTGASGNSNLGNSIDGILLESGASGNTIGGTVTGSRNTISGNDANGVELSGDLTSGNFIRGNYIGTNSSGTGAIGNSISGVWVANGAANNTIGGTLSNSGNVISDNGSVGVEIRNEGSSGNLVQGNYVGTNAAGTVLVGSQAVGIRVQDDADGNTIGGNSVAARNIISGNGRGVSISNGPTNTLVVGNYIGTDVTGTIGLGNYSGGVFIIAAGGNTIGGTSAALRNVISDNQLGIHISFGGGNSILGNFIGTHADGTGSLGNADAGVEIINSSGNSIGGTLPESGNTISSNGGHGVSIISGATNSILSNSISLNGGLGIDLGADGVTPNDAGDGDAGANELQNFPQLSSALYGGSNNTSIDGILDSDPNTTYTIQYFVGACDVSGGGQGGFHFGSANVTTNSNGRARLDLVLSATISPGSVITTTATNPSGSTSEFSQCITVCSGAGSDSDEDGLLDGWECHGYDADDDGVIDVDLPAMGADPMHRDIFVEVDWMAIGPGETQSHRFNTDAREIVITMFRNAPIMNPDGQPGINLHIDVGQGAPFTGGNEIPHDMTTNDFPEFFTYKADHFDPHRSLIFHYCVFAHRYAGDLESSGLARTPGLNFMVTLGADGFIPPGTTWEQAGTFAHELGHNLGLQHGGGDKINHKANYLSIMNYLFQFDGLIVNGQPGHFDYSRWDLPDLNENALDETVGISGGAPLEGFCTRYFGELFGVCRLHERCPWLGVVDWGIDWNLDFNVAGTISADINSDVCAGGRGILTGFDDWSAVEAGLAAKALKSGNVEDSSEDIQEMTYPEYMRVAVFHGDMNDDKLRDIVDVVALIDYAFRNGSPPEPHYRADCKCDRDGLIDVTDVVYLINHVFRHGPVPCP